MLQRYGPLHSANHINVLLFDATEKENHKHTNPVTAPEQGRKTMVKLFGFRKKNLLLFYISESDGKCQGLGGEKSRDSKGHRKRRTGV